MGAIPLRQDIIYPESDGQPMAESDLHREEMVDLIAGLQRRYRETPDVYVAGNLFFYFVRGDPRSVVAPDVFLVRGVPKGRRKTYKLWEEGRVPSLVVEVTSESTSDEDLAKKKRIYEQLGVEEYFLHDPLGEYLSPRLQGHRLVRDRYEPLSPTSDGSLLSRVTGLTLKMEGLKLRLIDTASGEPLPWVEELDLRALQAEERAEIEAAARRVAEHRVEIEAAARRIAEERAEIESAARRALEAELARLRRELEGRKSD
jgi:Uma2 family endonuclease